jgi:hypothetical protein
MRLGLFCRNRVQGGEWEMAILRWLLTMGAKDAPLLAYGAA